MSKPVTAKIHASGHCFRLALFVAAGMQLLLYGYRTLEHDFITMSTMTEGVLHCVSLLVLLFAASMHHHLNTRWARHVDQCRLQFEHVFELFHAVSHRVCRDMHVSCRHDSHVVEEKAQRVAEKSQTDVAMLEEDIRQLSALRTSLAVQLQPLDAVLLFQGCISRLVPFLPPLVSLRLELEQSAQDVMPKIVADEVRLSLSFSQLIDQSLADMPHGGEIVVRLLPEPCRSAAGMGLMVQICVVRALFVGSSGQCGSVRALPEQVTKQYAINDGSIPSRALKNSGVREINICHQGHESLLTLYFDGFASSIA